MKKTTTGAPRNFKWSKKKTAITATSLVLALTMVIGLLPHNSLLRAAAAGSGVITSVSGANSIPDEYQAVNVPASAVTGRTTNGEAVDSNGNGLVAFDFHIFANEFASNAHTCGNVAVDDFGGTVLGESGAPEIGSREEHDTTSAKMSYVVYPENWTLVHNDLVLGSGNKVEGTGQVFLTNKDGKSFMMGNNNGGFLDNKYVDDTTPMINIQDELDDAERYQGYLFDLMNSAIKPANQKKDPGPFGATRGYVANYDADGDGTNDGTVRVLNNNELFTGPAFGPGTMGFGFGPGGKTIDLKQYPEDTIIINFKPGEMWSWFGTQKYHEAINFLSGSVELKGTLGKRVIINIDTAGWDGDMSFFDTHMKADNLTNEEDSVHKDNNILWNFYDSTKKQSFDKKIEVGGTWIGTILAPDADVKCRAGLNGSIIANRVATTAETHKSDYTGEKSITKNTSVTVTKKWVNDNAESRPDAITVKLYQNNKVFKTVDVSKDKVGSSTSITYPDGVECKFDTTNTDPNKWIFTFSNLPVADATGKTYRYKVDEVVPAGYKSQVSNYTIINTGEGGTPAETGDLYFKKTDANGSNMIAGARFKLTSDEGNNLSKVTGTNVDNLTAGDSEVTWTSQNKVGKLTNLPYGNYTITEISAPSGYKKSNDSVRVSVPGTTDATAKYIANEVLSAKFLKRESLNHMAIAGGEFELKANWGQNLSGVTVDGATASSVNSDKITFTAPASEVTFNKIPAGSYTITETKAPAGYDIAAPVTFNVGEDGSVTNESYSPWQNGVVTMDDDEHIEKAPEYGVLTFTKNKTNGTALAGATFKLANVNGADISGDTDHVLTATGTTLDTTHAAEGYITFTTGNSAVAISNLLAGTYTLTETAAPAGYKPASPASFTITADNTSAAPCSVTVTDQPIELKISKKDMTSGAELAGAGLTLYESDGTTVKVAEWTTGTVKTISPIAAGTYVLKETTVPAGYNAADPINITIDAYGNISGSNVSGNTVTMYDKPSTITVKKVIGSTTTNLTGAKMQLTSDSGADLSGVTGLIDLKHKGTDTITWTTAAIPQELRMLPDGNYTLTELEAPEGYAVAAEKTITVSGGKITAVDGATLSTAAEEVTMSDTKLTYYDIDFSKVTFQYNDDGSIKTQTADEVTTNLINEAPIAGATLGIFDQRSKSYTPSEAIKLIETVGPTDTQPTVRLSDGYYVLAELEAPEGYEKTDNKVKFHIADGKLYVDGVASEELASASYGNPNIDEGLSVTDDCFYTLETSEIFERYGKFPGRVVFTLDKKYKCDSFVLYKDDCNPPAQAIVTATPTNGLVVDNAAATAGTSDLITYSADFTAAGEYDPAYKYYAVIDIKNADGTAVEDPEEIGGVDLNFAYVEGVVPIPLKLINAETHQYQSRGDTDYWQDVYFNPMSKMPDKIEVKFIPDPTYEGDPIIQEFQLQVGGLKHDNQGQTPRRTFGYIEWKVVKNSGVETIYLKDFPKNTFTANNGQNTVLDNVTITSSNSELFRPEWDDTVDCIKIGTTTVGIKEVVVYINGTEVHANGRTELTSADIKVNNDTTGGSHAKLMLPNGIKKEVAPDCAVEMTKVKKGETSTVLPGAKFILLDKNRQLVTDIYKSAETTQDGKTVYTYKHFVADENHTAAENAAAANYTVLKDSNNEIIPINTEDNPLVTDGKGVIKVEGLPEGTFTFVEIEAPGNYELSTDPETSFVLTPDHTATKPKTLTIENALKQGELEFIKYDENGTPMPGAVFELHRIDLTNGQEDTSFKIENITTGNDGKYTVKGLDLNYLYYAYETSAAPGTVIPNVQYVEATGNSKEQPRLTQDDVSKYHDSFYDVTRKLGGAKFADAKYDKDEEMKHYGIILAEASDRLYVLNTDKYIKDANGQWPLKDGYKYNDDFTKILDSSNNEVIAVENVTDSNKSTYYKDPVRRYVLKSGYEFIDYDEFTIRHTNGTEVTDEEELSNAVDQENSDKTQAYIRVDPTNTGTIAMINKSTKVVVKKTDGSDILPGAKFRLDLAEGTDADALDRVSSDTATDLTKVYDSDHEHVEYVTWTSTDSANGDIIYGLKNGTYTITETEAPAGYEKAAAQTVTVNQTAEVTDLSTVTYTFVNTPTPIPFSLNAKKILEGRELAADDFSFTVTGEANDSDGVLAGRFTTGTSVTASNTADGTVSFGTLADYTVKDLGKTFRYKVVENEPDTKITGVTYDKKVYTVDVTINMVDGAPQAQITRLQYTEGDSTTACSSIKFTNTYTSAPAELAPTVTKTYNRNAAAESFTFVLKKGDEVIQTVKSPELTANNAGTISFSPLTFSEVGEYTYTIAEVAGTQSGVSYDSRVYTWTVTVTDNGSGTLQASETYKLGETAATSAAFENTYSVSGSVNATVEGTKTLTGKDLADNMFTFVLTQYDVTGYNTDDEAWTVKTGTSPVEVPNTGSSFDFTKTFTEEGTYYFKITEKPGTLGGVEYDTSAYKWIVTVSDNGQGGLAASGKLLDKDGNVVSKAAFTNNYSVKTTVNASVSGVKTLTGKTLTDGMFTFKLTECTVDGDTWTAKEGEPITATNKDGQFIFTRTFNAPGTYYFTITEDSSSPLGGVEYDKSEYRWTVVIDDNGEGSYVVTSSTLTKNGETKTSADFTNEYTAQGAEAQVSVRKTYNGSSADVFTFKLHETSADTVTTDRIADQTKTVTGSGSVSFDTISYTAAGTHTYQITEVSTDPITGVTYDNTVYNWTVAVTDNGSGQLVVNKTLNNGTANVEGDTATFNNIYKAIDISKKAVGGGAELDGAKLTITAIDDVDLTGVSGSKTGTAVDNTAKTIKWTSGGEANKIYGLPAGIYELKEETAPDGYLRAESIYFKAEEDGTFKQVTKVVTDNGDGTQTVTYNEGDVITEKTVTMVDGIINATISKTAVTGGPELAGAKLEITALDANADLSKVGKTEASGGKDFDAQTSKITWESTDKSLELTKLPAGNYAMTETIAPAGYAKATTIYFNVDENGKLHELTVVKNEGSADTYEIGDEIAKVEMVDEIFNATISKTAVTGGPELPGAKLEIAALDANADLSKVGKTETSGGKDFDAQTGKITWESTDKSLELTGLPAGIYAMTETIAPAGYAKATTIYFCVDENGKLHEVEVVENTDGTVTYTAKEDEIAKVEMVDEVFSATISKTAVTGGPELPGAKLEIAALDANADLSKVGKTETSGGKDFDAQTGKITWESTDKSLELTGLPAGKYAMTETIAPEGYAKATTIYFCVDENGKLHELDVITNEEDGTVTYTAKEDEIAKVEMVDEVRSATISKVDTGSGEELPGAKLTVTALDEDADISGVVSEITPDSKTEKSITWTSGEEANKLSKLPAGEYQLKEVTAPDGYEIEEVIYFKVDEDGTVYNKTKTEYDTEGSEWKKVDNKTVIMKDAPITATISKQATGGGNELPGAKLTVTSMYEDVKLDKVESKITPESQTETSITWVSTDEANELSKLPVGVYQLKEVTSPDGYDVAEIIYFNVDQKGNVTSVPAKDYKADGSTDWKAVEDDTVIMEDAPTTATISKVATGSGDELPGAKLTVTAMDENGTLKDVTSKLPSEKSEDNKSITWTSGETPNELSKLLKGVYELKEVTAPNGYEIAEKIYFKVGENGVIESVPEADYKGESTEWKPVDDKHIIMEDAPTPDRTATISKVDTGSGKELPGAKLTVTAMDENGTLKDVTSKLNATKSDDNKSITWTSGETPNELSKLPAGVYELKEVTAPDGYEVAEKIYFKVDEDGTVKSVPEKDYDADKTDWSKVEPVSGKKIIMKDAPIPPAEKTATISKVDTGSGKELPGAKLTVTALDKDVTLADVSSKIEATKSDDNKSITWTSGDTPNVLSKLPAGVYELKEVTAPDGYEVAENIYFKVEEDGTIKSVTEKDYDGGKVDWTKVKAVDDKTVIMKDAPSSKGGTSTFNFSFNKKNNFDKALAGAVFQLKGDNYDKTATSDVSGKVTFADVAPGVYSLTETTAPNGYNRYTGTITVTCSEDGTFTFKQGNNPMTLAQVESAVVNKVTVKEGPGSKNLKIGDTIDLKKELPAEYQNEEITWRTADGRIVSVDQNGIAKVLGAGETTITAYSKDGTPLMTFVLGAEEEATSVVVPDSVPNTRDMIIKYLKIATLALIISSMIVFGCIYLYKRRKNAKTAN